MGRWILLCAALAGCGGEPPEAEEHDHHAHSAVYGGVLVEIGDHLAQVELVHDPDAATVTAYVWDGHVEKPIFLTMDAIELSVETGTVTLRPVEDPKTGDRAGHASKFVGKAEGLESIDGGTIRRIDLSGRAFEALEIGG
jgi:hypothetical protein